MTLGDVIDSIKCEEGIKLRFVWRNDEPVGTRNEGLDMLRPFLVYLGVTLHLVWSFQVKVKHR